MAAATTIDDVAPYVSLHPDSGVYRYYRRVPQEARPFDKRVFVRQSLRTKSLAEAQRKAIPVHDACVALWASLIAGAEARTAFEKYDAAVKLAQSLGFEYRTAAEIVAGPLDELVQRVETAAEHGETPQVAAAVLGTVPPPEHRVSDIWELYEEHNADGLLGMSPKQFEKHKVSRLRAIRYLQEKIGNKKLSEITRADAQSFRQWWIDKVKAEGLTAYAANRSLTDLRGMLSKIDEALKTDYWSVWAKVRMKETNATALKKRRAFSPTWVRDKILAEGALDGMDFEARCILYIFAETGARPGGEIGNFRPQDIRLQGEPIDGVPFVPHIEVAERDDRRQKSENAIRRIPLVGVALWAAQQCPNGFPRWHDKGDALSDHVNEYMRNRGLFPTDRHTFYSLRHTFQDRIENADCSDRMQADLMGHEFGRPLYGDGPELARRQALLQSIAFDVPWLKM